MPDNNQQFERAFGELSFAAIRDAIPILMRFMIGFQLVEKSDNNAAAIGVFGFDVNGTKSLIPVFFLNGKIKGKDMAYVVDQDFFHPLTEEWITYYINKRPEVLGDLIAKTKGSKYKNVDLSSFSESPLLSGGVGKRAMAEFNGDREAITGKVILGKAFDIGPILRAAITPVDGIGLKKAASMFDLGTLAAKYGYKVLQKVSYLSRQIPRVGEALSKFYDGGELLKVAGIESTPPSTVRPYPTSYLERNGFTRGLFNHYIEKYAQESRLPDNIVTRKFMGIVKKQSLTPASAREHLGTLKSEPVSKEAASNGTVEFYRHDTGYTEGLSDTEKQDLFDNGWFVKDARAATTIAYQAGAVDSIVNPSGSCRFSVLKGQELKQAIVLAAGKNWFVIYKDGAIHKYNSNKNIFGYQDLLSTDDLEKYPKAGKAWGAPEVEDGEAVKLPRGKNYLLVHEGRVIEVRGVLSNGDGVYSCYLPDDSRDSAIIVNKDAPTIRTYNSVIVLPTNTRVIDISDVILTTAPTATTYDLLKGAKLTPATMWKQAGRYYARIGSSDAVEGTMVDMACELVVKHGLTKSAASDVLSQTETTPKPFFFKYAVELNTTEDGGIFDDVAEVQPEEDVVEPIEAPDRNSVQQMYQAAQRGEKEIFDMAMLPSLIKKMYIDDDISDWLKSVLVGMDRVGRMLFMFYWHQEKFVDKYGETEMAELEDMFRNVFRSTGDLVLFLLQKEVGETAGLGSSIPDLDVAV